MRLYIPWTLEQVIALQERQEAKNLHPYTCESHGGASLVPTTTGWHCPIENCDYQQIWCFLNDATEPRWWEK